MRSSIQKILMSHLFNELSVEHDHNYSGAFFLKLKRPCKSKII